MKKMKKLVALIIATAMVLSMMSIAAFAADGDGYKVTITKDATDEGTHTYEAYQIFAGDLADNKLSNITWGTGIDQSKLGDLADAINALRDTTVEGYVALTATSTAQQFADAISGLNATDDSATAQKVAEALAAALSSTSKTGDDTGVGGLAAGYYLVQDKSAPVAPDDTHNSGAQTRYILQVVENVTVNEKASVPSVEKKVKDANDTTDTAETTNAYQDSADYDIGDAVPFQITGTTASTADDYVKYHVTFVDDQSEGLDAPEQFSIAVLGQTLALNNAAGASADATVGKIKVTASIVTAGADFSIKVAFENTDNAGKTEGLVKLGSAVESQNIVITYTSKLNANAVLGATGNPNEVKLKYSANPNSSDDSEEDEGETPKDKVIVFTYKPVVNKVDENNQPLEGAGFTLYKEVGASYVAQTGETVQTGAEIKAALKAQNASINAAALKDASKYVAKAMTTVSGSTTSFEFKGIDDGTYVLVETTIPAGYNAFVAEEVQVSATHDVESDDPQLKTLTGGNRFSGDIDAGTLTGNVENQSGAVLPSTGGIGTTIFYVIGAILVIGAGVVLVTRRRMEA